MGSNIGDKRQFIDSASGEIISKIGRITKYSSFYQTSPWGFESEDEFVNKVICVKSDVEPLEVMIRLLEIENALGRERSDDVSGYHSRTIDLDILLIDDLILSTEKLIVPHPRMQERKFVLVPLNEIAADVIHPIAKMTISELLNSCSDKESVIKL